MESITITVTESSNGGYVYQVWAHDLEVSAMLAEEGSTEGDDNGGLCTSTLLNALGMALEQAESLIERAD